MSTPETKAYFRSILLLIAIILATAGGQGVQAYLAGSREMAKDAADWGYDVVIYAVALVAFGRGVRAEILASLAIAAALAVAAAHTLYEFADKVVTGRMPDPFVAEVSTVLAIMVACVELGLLWRFRVSTHPLIAATWFSARNSFVSGVGLALVGLVAKLAPMQWPDLALDLFAAGLNLQAAWVIVRDVRAQPAVNPE